MVIITLINNLLLYELVMMITLISYKGKLKRELELLRN